MLSLTHNTKALCCYNDFSLPPLIKCFAKLSGKYFPFHSQKLLREEDREKTVLRVWSALVLPVLHQLGWFCRAPSAGKHKSSWICTKSKIPSLIISASDRSRIQILGMLFPHEGFVVPVMCKAAQNLPTVHYGHGTSGRSLTPLQVSG